MGNLTSLEQRIANDWGWLRANIALHPYWSTGISFLLGAGAMWLKAQV